MSMMRKLLEAMTKFASEPEQKPGEQWKGTDKGTPGKKLVGDSIIKDLSKGVTPKTKEEELAEAFANFNEDDLGVEPKRPGRKSDRPSREYTKNGNPSKRYTPVKEGWNNGTDRVQLADSTSAYWNGTGRLQNEYNELYEKLVPSQGAAETLEGEVLRAASKIVYRHFNDGDLFNKASFDQLKGYIGSVTSYDDLAEKAVEYALRAQGNYHPNAGWDSLDVMDYGPEEEEEYDDDEEDDDSWDHDDDEDLLGEGEHDAEFIDHEDNWYNMADWARAEFKKGKTVQDVIKYLRDNDYLGPQDTNNFMKTVRGEKWNESVEEGMEEFAKSQAKQRAAKRKSIPWPKEVPSDASQERDRTRDEEENDPHPYADTPDLDEGADDVYSITSERNGRERTKSGTLAELIEYYSYTLETGKSYEHERGNRKINLNPKSIESLVQNLNNAKSNAAANGQSNERFYVDHGNMAEGRGPSKGLHKKVTIVKGRDAGKTGYVRQIKTDKLRNRVYLDLDLEDGGQAVVLKQDVRLVKDLAENYTGRETKDGVWRVFKDGQGGSVAGPFKSAEEANAWIKKQNQGVVEARTTWNNDFYVYDPKTKTVKKKFRTHKGAKQYAEANGLAVASAEYYHDSINKEVEEGWESGPEERTRVERDPDADYDARRQERLDAEADSAPKTTTYQCVGRGPNNEPNYKFGPEHNTSEEAVAYRKKLMANPKTPNPRDIGIRTISKVAKGINEDVTSTDPLEGALLDAIHELIGQGHTDVDPMVLTNMVVAATSQPFLLKDLVDANNNSQAVQHYIDSISPSKVKFSADMLTVKNEDPAKDKAKAQAGVSSMASRAANRNRLGEGTETPLQNKEDYNAKRKALQDIQLDPDTAKDPQLKAEVIRRLASLNQQYSMLREQISKFKESRGHKVIATKLGNMDRMQNVQVPSPAERQEQLRIAKEKEQAGKKQVKEFAAPGANPAAPGATNTAAKPVVDPAAVAKAAAATNTLKAATGTVVAPATLDKALDSATQGTATSTDVKALAPIMGVVNKAASDPKLAAQFKNLANQAKTTP